MSLTLLSLVTFKILGGTPFGEDAQRESEINQSDHGHADD